MKLKKAAEARHVSGLSLNGGLEKPLDEAVKLKPGLICQSQDVIEARIIRCLSRRAGKKEWN